MLIAPYYYGNDDVDADAVKGSGDCQFFNCHPTTSTTQRRKQRATTRITVTTTTPT